MDRRTFLRALGAAAATPSGAFAAAPPGRQARVGYLDSGIALGSPMYDAFVQGLRDHGWIVGRNLSIAARGAAGDYERLPALARELVELPVDVLFASSTPAALAAKRASSTVPIVIGRVADPVASGLVATLARPGGNVTGWSHQGLALREKYVELIAEAVPTAPVVGVMWNPDNPIHEGSLPAVQAAAKVRKVQLALAAVSEVAEIDAAFATFDAARAKALVVFSDGFYLAQGPRIIDLAAKARLPALYGATELARAGGLMGYGVNLPDMYRRGAGYVDRILNGADPANLPVQQPTSIELVINLRTAKALGLALPASLLARADALVQ
jgi:putative ABC transport system substrate-binding protein